MFACNPAVARWFDYPREHENWRPRVELAITLCSGCPMRELCLQAGKRDRETGVWGGVLLDAGRPVYDHLPPEPTGTLADYRAAHAAWTRGVRDDWTEHGERAYQRLRKRAQVARKKGEAA